MLDNGPPRIAAPINIVYYIISYIYILSASWKLPGRFFMVSVVDITQRFRMVSVVGFFMVSVVAGNVFLWFPSLVF